MQKEPLKAYERRGAPISLAWSPDGKVFAHGNQEATINFWYAESAEHLQMSGYANKVRELSWDPTGRYLATGGGSAVCIWDCGGKGPEGSTPQMLQDNDSSRPISALTFQHRGFLIISGTMDGKLNLWQPANKKSPGVGSDQLDDVEVSAAVWSPDDKQLIAGTGSGRVALYRIA
jgi:WD40 repeat protein